MGNTNTNNVLTIPYLKHDKVNKNINRNKINDYVIYAFNNYCDEESDDGGPRIVVPPNHGLNTQELKIAQGIILANAISYWETDREF